MEKLLAVLLGLATLLVVVALFRMSLAESECRRLGWMRGDATWGRPRRDVLFIETEPERSSSSVVEGWARAEGGRVEVKSVCGRCNRNRTLRPNPRGPHMLCASCLRREDREHAALPSPRVAFLPPRPARTKDPR